ncbi:MAG: YcaO-like family protein, partial [Blastocatellia bacterium]
MSSPIIANEAAVTLAKSRRLISPLTGVIRSVEEVPLNEEDAAEISLFVSSLSDASRIDIPLSNRLHGATGETKEVAKAKAIGEAIERYCAARFDPEELIVASYKDVSGRAIHPSQFSLYSPAQYAAPGFPYPRFDEMTRISWVKGYNLTREEHALVPACLTYLPHQLADPHESVLAPAISTGLACRGTLREAAITAICEVVERDACMIMWLNGLSMPNVV